MSGIRLTLRDGVGTKIDAAETVRFTFDGKPYKGQKGDTIASALMANGVTIVARSFKYHRPRGIVSAGSEEPSALVTMRSGARREPNVRATEVELYEGLEAHSQNRWPSVAFDLMAVNQLPGKAFAAGFYYKTFMGAPAMGTKFWWFCEQFIRRAAGLGKPATEADPDRYARTNAFCDVLVVGAGAAGISAAKRAASAGAKVILCDERANCGGSLASAPEYLDGEAARDWAKEQLAELAAMNNVTLLTRTTVQSLFDGDTYFAVERVADHKLHPAPHEPRQRAWTIYSKSAVIATGTIERPIVFGGNDKPGVMLADAARRYALEYGVAPGKAVAVFTNNDTGWLAARDMARAGVIVTGIIDTRNDVADAVREAGKETRAAIYTGSAVVRAKGFSKLASVEIADFSETTGSVGEHRQTISCDCLAVSGGWSPAFHSDLTTGWETCLGCRIAGLSARRANIELARCWRDDGQVRLASSLPQW